MSGRAVLARRTENLQPSFIGCPQKTADFGNCAVMTADRHAQKRNFSIILSCPSVSSRTGAWTSSSGFIGGSYRNCPDVLNSAAEQHSWGVALSAGTNSRPSEQGMQVPLRHVYSHCTHPDYFCTWTVGRGVEQQKVEWNFVGWQTRWGENTEMNLWALIFIIK